MHDSFFIIAEKYKSIFFLTDNDLTMARTAGQAIRDEMEAVDAEHNAWMMMQDGFLSDVSDEAFEALEKLAKDNWEDLVGARIDGDYVQRQRNMGYLFHNMGFPYEKCLAASSAYYEIFENVLLRHELNDFQVLRAFKKIANISSAIIIDTYNEIANEKMRQQHAILMEMSTPVTQLWKGILLLPLVGILDSKRAQDTMNAMLEKISITQSKVFILDISGIAVMDTAVANYIIKITKATRLMGCKCIISGISPAVAQTIVELGIQVDEIDTTGNMQDALANALAITGSKIISE